jgi:hypothetical protein
MKSRIWILLHALVALSPVIGAVAQAPDVPLFGSEVAPALPAKWSLEGWRHEEVQPSLQAWFEAHVGFRGVMVRTDNTVHTVVLGDSKPGSTVILGNDDTLFFRDDILFMSTRQEDLTSVLARVDVLTDHLGAVHRKLDARGKKLVAIISPSKSLIYPDAVPSRWRRSAGDRSDLVVHAALRAGLERHGVPFGDGMTTLAGRSGAERELVYPRSGRHWSTYGACTVLRATPLPASVRPSCEYEMAPSETLAAVDFDLYRLQNVWRVRETAVLAPKLAEVAAVRGTEQRQRTLFAGTSFTWMLGDVLRPSVDTPVAMFYNTSFYDLSDSAQRLLGPVDPLTAIWVSRVLDRDLYIVEILDTYAHGEHMISFLETLDHRLD